MSRTKEQHRLQMQAYRQAHPDAARTAQAKYRQSSKGKQARRRWDEKRNTPEYKAARNAAARQRYATDPALRQRRREVMAKYGQRRTALPWGFRAGVVFDLLRIKRE